MLENGDVWPKFEDGIAAAAAESEKEAHSSLISFRRCPYMTSTEKGKGVKSINAENLPINSIAFADKNVTLAGMSL